jgi:hypothetical protein
MDARQSGGTSAAAGKREQKEWVRVVRRPSIACHQLCDAVAGMRFNTVDWSVDHIVLHPVSTRTL